MTLRPRLHILLFIYLFFGGIIIGLLAYVFSYKMGKQTELNYLKIVETEINDTIFSINNLPTKDFAYPHAGGIKKLELKNNAIQIPLYLDSYENVNRIMVGEKISKEKNSRTITIYNEYSEFDIVLQDLIELRKEKGKTERLKWIIVYLVLGIIISFIPMQSNRQTRKKN